MKLFKNSFLLSLFLCLLSTQVNAQFRLVKMDTLSYYGYKDSVFRSSHMGVVNGKSIAILSRNRSHFNGNRRFPNVELYATDSNYTRKLIYKWNRIDSMVSLSSWDFKTSIVRTDTMLYFIAENTFFSEIWQTDGTSAGTKRWVRLRHGAPKSYPDFNNYDITAYSLRGLTLVNKTLVFGFVDSKAAKYDHRNHNMCYFNLETSEFGMLKNVDDYEVSRVEPLHNFPNEGYAIFETRSGFYVTNGTKAGTHQLVLPTPNTKWHTILPYTFSLGNKVYSQALSDNRDSSSIYEYERITEHDTTWRLLWKGKNPNVAPIFRNALISQDENNKTRLTISNGQVKIDSHNWYLPTPYLTDDSKLTNGKYIFTGNTTNHGREPWVTDLTQKGTYLLRDTRPGKSNGGVHTPISLGNLVLFSNGRTPYLTDGTVAGTHRALGISAMRHRPEFMGHPLVLCYNDSVSWVAHLVQDGLTINGLVFHDENGDGKHDKGEEGVFDQRIQIGPGNISVGTDNLGIISGYVKN